MTTIPDPATTPTITVPEAAQLLGIGLRSAYAAAARGELPAIHAGRSVRVVTRRLLDQFDLTGERQPVSLER
jgi:excisionase family DNA binding protein